MATIPFDTIEEADARSAEMWTDILGTSKNPANVTEYLYGRQQRTGDAEADVGLPAGVDYAIVVTKADEHLDTLLRQDQMSAEEVAALVSLYPAWSGASVAYGIGDIVSYNGTLYTIVQPHTSQPDWTPDVTPALWNPCAPAGVIPEWVQPTGAHNSYALGAQVTHKGQVWESTVAANVWEPGVYGWIVVE